MDFLLNFLLLKEAIEIQHKKFRELYSYLMEGVNYIIIYLVKNLSLPAELVLLITFFLTSKFKCKYF